MISEYGLAPENRGRGWGVMLLLIKANSHLLIAPNDSTCQTPVVVYEVYSSIAKQFVKKRDKYIQVMNITKPSIKFYKQWDATDVQLSWEEQRELLWITQRTNFYDICKVDLL